MNKVHGHLVSIASRIRCFEAEVVHGFLQTPEYAAAISGVEPGLSVEIVDQRVKLRMERQKTRADVTVILGEAALSLVVGSPDIMAAQLAHLRSADAHPNIRARVLPFTAGAYPRRGSFALLEFDDDEDPPVVYVEAPGAGKYLDEADDWANYRTVWQFLTDRSIPMEEWK